MQVKTNTVRGCLIGQVLILISPQWLHASYMSLAQDIRWANRVQSKSALRGPAAGLYLGRWEGVRWERLGGRSWASHPQLESLQGGGEEKEKE